MFSPRHIKNNKHSKYKNIVYIYLNIAQNDFWKKIFLDK